MKKLLKISTLALTMSAVLFSCANPNNTPSAPKVETVKPTDVVKPEGFTPAKDSKSVTTKEDAEKIVNKIMQEYNSYSTVINPDLENKVYADPKNAEELKKGNTFQEEQDKKIAEGKDFSLSEKVTMTPASYTFDYGTSKLILAEESVSSSYKFTDGKLDMEKSKGEMKEHKIGKFNIENPTKVSRPTQGINTNFIKSFISSVETENTAIPSSSSTNKTNMNLSAMFEVDGFNGIVLIESKFSTTREPNKEPKVTNSISYTFYDLEGKNVTLETVTNTTPKPAN